MTSLPPVVDLNGAAAGHDVEISYTENDPVTPLAPGATASDADSADFDQGSLTVAFTAGGTADDQLRIVGGDFSVDEADLYYQGVPIGTVVGGTDGSSPLVVTFNVDVTPAIAQALIRAVGYVTYSDSPLPGERRISFTPTATAEPALPGWRRSPSGPPTRRRSLRTTGSPPARIRSRPEACSRTMAAAMTTIPTGRP